MGNKRRKLSAVTHHSTGIDAVLEGATEKTIAIGQIRLDPAQPRRAMPAEFRQDWIAGALPENVLQQWEDAALAEVAENEALRAAVADWDQVINPPDGKRLIDDDELENSPVLNRYPSTAQWMRLVALAADIKAAGLNHRIAVYKTGPSEHRVLFGERRFLAFQLLNWMGQDGYDEIPAFVTDEYDPVKQAIENASRENLNAIATARQMAILLLYWTGETPPESPGWDWYALAAGIRTPRGKGGLLMRACGLGSKQAVMDYRLLLALPADLAVLADEYNLKEGLLRGALRQGLEGTQLRTYIRQACNLEAKPVKPGPSALDLTDRVHKAIKPMVKLSEREIRDMPKQQRDSLKEVLQDLLRRL